jgi:hypothetical protein
LTQADGEYKLSDAQLSTCIFRDRVDFLIVAEKAFNLTHIEADWYGSQSKIYIRKELNFLSNLARERTSGSGSRPLGKPAGGRFLACYTDYGIRWLLSAWMLLTRGGGSGEQHLTHIE